MRARSFAALLIAATVLPAAAQDSRLALTGAVALGMQGGGYQSFNTQDIGGWGLGVAYAPDFGSSFTGRVDAGFGALNNGSFWENNPGGGGATYATDFQMAGASLNVMWRFLGVHHSVSPYIVGGAGLYAIRSMSTNVATMGTAPTQTIGSPVYNAGVGVQISKFFIEARAMRVQRALVPVDFEANGHTVTLDAVPVSIGFWF